MADYAKGQVLRELRSGCGRSRETVAADLKVTTKTLYSWENDGGIKRENAERLAAYYGIDDYTSLVTRDPDGGDQLDRLEAKLDAILAHLGVDAVTSPGESDEPEVAGDLPDPKLGPDLPTGERGRGTSQRDQRRAG